MIQIAVLAETNTANKKYNKLCEQANKLIEQHKKIKQNTHIKVTDDNFVQVGQYKTNEQARFMEDILIAKGYPAYWIERENTHFVIVFKKNYTREEAELVAKDLENSFYGTKKWGISRCPIFPLNTITKSFF
jgi:recombinational DNA repair ATPase RecF